MLPAMDLQDLTERLQLLKPPSQERWHRHPNGLGWVEHTAIVASTAYVGPEAVVLDMAQVLENTQIRDKAVVDGSAIVAGTATVSGDARVGEMAVVAGNAEIGGRSWVGGNAALTSGSHNDVTIRPWAPEAVFLRDKAEQTLQLG